jgi:hypothetical protein
MTISKQFSGTIDDAKITLQVQDTDDDSSGTIEAKTQEVTFDMTVNPVVDTVTLQVKQPIGEEDAGRSTGNTINDATADDIDEPENGIQLDINVISDDIDGSEKYTVTIDGVPDGGSLYVYDKSDTSWHLIDKDTADAGNLAITDNDDSTWKVTITDYDNSNIPKFIPIHNDDQDYTFEIEAYSTDGNAGDSVAQTLSIDVMVQDVADIPINDDLAVTTITDDNSDSNSFTLSATEDTTINLKDILATPDTLASYDSDGSETVTIKVTNLADGFSIGGSGATFITGSGDSRIWFVDVAELNNDNVILTTPQNYAGEVDFDIYMVTTEDAGNSKTHDVKNVSVMVEPVAEASVNTVDTQDEDIDKILNFDITKPDSDDANAGVEVLKTFAIDMSTVDDGVTLVGSVSGELSGSDYVELNVDENGVLETVTATLAEDSNLNGSYDFNIKYTIDDIAIDSDGNKYTNTKSVTDEPYTVTVNAITDEITLTSTTTTDGTNITDDADGNITVSDNDTFTKTLTVTGIDSDGRGNLDEDGSEKFTRIEVGGVPEGISVVDGVYAGDSGAGNYSGYWYVNIDDIALDGSSTTYDLKFDVDGDLSNGTHSTITIKAFNEDSNNDSEQEASISFDLDVDKDVEGDKLVPFEIIKFYQDIDNDSTHDHDYEKSTTTDTTVTDDDAYEGSILREDTQFKLSDVIHVETDTSDSSDNHFSIVIYNVPEDVLIEGMTYNSTGDYYTISGEGEQDAIVTAMNNILITPILNSTTDANNIDNTDLNFDIELTAYAKGGDSNTALINFTGSVLPITDNLDFTTINDGITDEDTDQTFSITLDNESDGEQTVIVDNKVYIQIDENYTDIQGGDGDIGVLKDGDGNIISTTETDPEGLPSGTYFVLDNVTYNDTLNFIYSPASNRDGNVDINFFVKNSQSESWNSYDTDILVSTKTISFDVNAVRDGYTFDTTSQSSTGDEDTMIQLSVSVSDPDSSELLTSVSLDRIPDGFLVYYGADESSATVAQNIGVHGQMTMQMNYGTDEIVDYNLWNIPLDNGEIPAYIGIKPPENWSGTIPQIVFNASDDFGSITTEPFDVIVNPVVDELSLSATKTFGSEGEDIDLKLNANVVDLDGSETVTLTLSGLGDDTASFKADGIAINSENITYDSENDIYTISDISALNLNKLSVIHSNMTDTTITTTAKLIESDGSESNKISDSFNLTIEEALPSGDDDILLYKGEAIDAQDGIDTLVLNGLTIDYANITNMEVIDLSADVNTLDNLTLDEVINMTDDNNDLKILGDIADSVNIKGNEWNKDDTQVTEGGHTFDVYTNSNDSSVILKVEDGINDHII